MVTRTVFQGDPTGLMPSTSVGGLPGIQLKPLAMQEPRAVTRKSVVLVALASIIGSALGMRCPRRHLPCITDVHFDSTGRTGSGDNGQTGDGILLAE
jgi:hypothetical protein